MRGRRQAQWPPTGLPFGGRGPAAQSEMVPDLHSALRNKARGQDLSDHLRVLLVASDEERAERLEQRLREIGDATILRVPTERDLQEAVAAAVPDAIVVHMARPERAALHDLRRVGAYDPRPVVMFVGFDDAAFLEEAIAAGISSYSVVRDAFPDLKPVVMAAVAIFRRNHQAITDLRQAKTMLAERETISRAKKLLMRERNMDEPRAYRWLRRRAMQESRPIAATAADLIAQAGKRNGNDGF